MSDAGSSIASGSSFSSSTGGASVASDNTDTRALDSLQEGADGEAGDDVGSGSSKPIEGLFTTIYTLTKNHALDTSLRVAAGRVVLEFLMFFRIVFNFSFPWTIRRDLDAWKAVEWVLVRGLVIVEGYDRYITVLYVMAGGIFSTLAVTTWVALVLKGSDSVNPWLRRLIRVLQLVALLVFCIAYPIILDYASFFLDCRWGNLAQGLAPSHVFFTDHSCTAMPHMVHMLVAVLVIIDMVACVLLMGMGVCDVNPLNRSLLSSSDEASIMKMLLLKIIFVLVSTALDFSPQLQAGLMVAAMFGVLYYLIERVPYYSKVVNCIYAGLFSGIMDVTVILLVTQGMIGKQDDPAAYKDFMTNVLLWSIFPAVALGAGLMWLRLRHIARLCRSLRQSYDSCKQSTLAARAANDEAKNGGSVVALMSLSDLRRVHRFRDVRQVKIVCREMRKWDEEGLPDAEAIDFGEFLIKCAMARMPNHSSLLVMYASFLLEAMKDGQTARTQLQLSQKASPSLWDNYNIYTCQQLAKQLKRDGDGLDLLSYVEFQRNYMACIRSHKAALTAQKAFWSSLLRDTIAFKDLQANVQAMEAAEQRGTAVYRRVMERYPGNGKIMKIYGRFLEYIRCEVGAAARYYEAAQKQGTGDSLLALTTSCEGAAAGLAAAGQVDEKVDGLAVINAQGAIMMVNAAALQMFGYHKGELEGKNVSVLMPQPISAQHDGFLQRYVETGQAHILSRTRAVTALHKDRHVFPLSLCVTRLSGVGTDSLFIGVMRHEPSAGTVDNQVVRFWTSAGGIILCSDSCVTDVLGIQAGSELVGRNFSNLCTDVEGVNKFMAAADCADEGSAQVAANPTFKTKMLHAFMAPVDVELSVQYGGHTDRHSGCRSIILHARILTESTAVLVVDKKGRIQHATTKLASLLGFAVQKLCTMELNALLPQPTCQMHGAWFKDPSQRIPASSCRAGAVVYLLAANGTKLPVTLKITTKEDAGNGQSTHVVQVTKATEQQRLNQQRMVLNINQHGVVTSVNPGVPKALFGFDGTQLMGQTLSSVIDLFSEWKAECGEEMSLLQLLVSQMMAATDPGGAATISASGGCASWRAGVHRPTPAGTADNKAEAANSHSSSLLHALHPNKVLPVCMKLEPVEQESEELLDVETADNASPILQVILHRSDALNTVVELDSHLNITHADEAAALIFGTSSKRLMHRSFAKLAGLSGVKDFNDLLGKQGLAKKGAMKNAAVASRAGDIRRITCTHIGDGQPLTLNMQAMVYDQGGHSRRVVRLQVVHPVSAAMEKLLAIKEGRDDPQVLQRTDTIMVACADVHRAGSPQGSSVSSEQAGGNAEPATGSPAVQGDKSARIHDWVRQASTLKHEISDSADDSPAESPRFRGQQQRKYADSDGMSDADAEVAVQLHGPGRNKVAALLAPEPLADASTYRHSNAESSEAGASFVGSMADGMSEAGNETAIPAVHEEELAVDMRRAKRLKKLMRMFSSSMAQRETQQWRQRTLFILAMMLVAHIACFGVIVSQLDARRANAVTVNAIGLSMTAASQSTLRLNLLHKCSLPSSSTLFFCSPASREEHGQRLALNTANLRKYHHSLYLGGDGLQPFRDERLIDFWTYKELSETLYYEADASGLPAFVNNNRTLWELGNVFLGAIEDIYVFKDVWGANMDKIGQWQYAFLNGPGSLFSGYAWSLDTFCDYTWQDLTKLSMVIIVLLVIEAVVVQLSCLAYKFFLLQRCNVANMKMFSVFLALPSATIRFMVSRPMLIDDSTNDCVDDDDLDLVEGAAAGQGAGQGTGAADNAAGVGKGDSAAPVKKSVRLAADDDDGDEKPGKEGRSSTKLKGKAAAGTAAKKTRPAVTGFAALKKKAHKLLFGWLDPRFKRNGKKLSPSTGIIWRFMVPLLLWLSVVLIIFGVSYTNLQGLQGPLASLNLSSHVMYRLAHARLTANLLAFSDSTNKAYYRAQLKSELDLLRSEYRTLLYGGPMMLQAEVSFDAVAPQAVLGNPAMADIFFRTTDCLRADKSTCYKPSDTYYDITHSGLDAQINRYIDETLTFASLPDNLTVASDTHYGFVFKVTAKDTYEGLQTASDLFVEATLQKLDAVKQLHIILLVITICCGALFLMVLYRPYIRALRRDTKAIVSMLSQLPAEVDIEVQVKTIVLGIVKPDGSKSVEGLAGAPGGYQLQSYGSGMPPMGGPGVRGGWGDGGGPAAQGGWFNRRSSNSNAGPAGYVNDPRMYSYGMYDGGMA